MTLRISRHALRTAALLTLLLPGVLFLLTWVKPIIALPSAAAALQTVKEATLHRRKVASCSR